MKLRQPLHRAQAVAVNAICMVPTAPIKLAILWALRRFRQSRAIHARARVKAAVFILLRLDITEKRVVVQPSPAIGRVPLTEQLEQPRQAHLEIHTLWCRLRQRAQDLFAADALFFAVPFSPCADHPRLQNVDVRFVPLQKGTQLFDMAQHIRLGRVIHSRVG